MLYIFYLISTLSISVNSALNYCKFTSTLFVLCMYIFFCMYNLYCITIYFNTSLHVLTLGQLFSIVSVYFYIPKLLRGIQGQKSWKHNFEITGYPKVTSSGSTFWLVLRSHALFQVPTRPKKSKMAIKAQNQSIDNSLLSYHKNVQPDWLKDGCVTAKKRMPTQGIIVVFRDFLAHNSVSP